MEAFIQTRSKQAMVHVPNLACCLFVQIKFYWNTSLSIHLSHVSSCFHTAMAELVLSSCERFQSQQSLKWLLSGLDKKMFANPGLYFCQVTELQQEPEVVHALPQVNEQVEDQRRNVTCLRSQSWEKPRPELRSSDS